ncbi:Low molecular weight protein tyrosine phosphatase [Mucinivorans hirudinis]|uniref:Low molecular weight protein tyrosine phosphatase n=1 Tax=Mucinivorans hirudinis TaxID=1433126 RepID=A0A060R7Z9_9BACT|nr:Low molecular weight protein tyrosine phosphatase [Mucinivorans hirudinis]
MKFLFVCLGNICRSPAAEGILRTMIQRIGIPNVDVDSAGTYGGHDGEKPDPRMLRAAAKRGYVLEHSAREIRTEDFEEFDKIFVMDDSNYDDVMRLAPDTQSQEKVERITKYCTRYKVDHVPDPYYNKREGFDEVLDILEDACEGIVENMYAIYKSSKKI